MNKIMSRVDWDTYFTELAEKAATRATCPRRQVGCVIVRDKRVVSTGYNGAPSGADHCVDVGCDLRDNHCKRAVHAEINAIKATSRSQRAGASLYCTLFPCYDCASAVAHSGIVEVVFKEQYKENPEVWDLLHYHGIVIRSIGT